MESFQGKVRNHIPVKEKMFGGRNESSEIIAGLIPCISTVVYILVERKPMAHKEFLKLLLGDITSRMYIKYESSSFSSKRIHHTGLFSRSRYVI